MRFDDPLRPSVAYRPAYCSPLGRVIAAIPDLQFTPDADESGLYYLVKVMLLAPTASRSYRWFEVRLRDGLAVEELLADWYLNPEDAMKKYFNWTYLEPQKAKAFSLDELEV